MHPILERQIKRHLGERASAPPEWEAFLEAVSRTYADFDDDRALLDRSLEISSKEFFEHNRLIEKTRAKVEEQAKNLATEVASRTKELNERVAELEDARRAMANLLEDLKEEQYKLTKAKAEDDAILMSIGDGLIATDEKGNTLFINKAAENLLGIKNEEIAGKNFSEMAVIENEKGVFVPLDKRPISMALAGTTTTTTTTTTTGPTYYYVRPDKTKFPASITATPVILNRKVIGAIVVFHDITKEKSLEKTRMDFLSLASHQLRTPLSGTKWLIGTLSREVLGPVNEKQKSYLDEIYQVNERMIKLVFDMLSVLRLESGKVFAKKKTISVSNLYEEASLMTASAAKNRGVEIHNALENHTEVVVETDAVILRLILETLISNAINYSERGQEIFLGAKEEPEVVVFFVKDSGIGIAKEEQGKISERFYRSSNAKVFKPDGTGLGLYTAYLLAEKIGAKIWFESEINKGTTFFLRVPKTVEIKNNTN